MKTSFIQIGEDKYLDAHKISQVFIELRHNQRTIKLHVFTDGESGGDIEIAVPEIRSEESTSDYDPRGYNAEASKKIWTTRAMKLAHAEVKRLLLKIEAARAE